MYRSGVVWGRPSTFALNSAVGSSMCNITASPLRWNMGNTCSKYSENEFVCQFYFCQQVFLMNIALPTTQNNYLDALSFVCVVWQKEIFQSCQIHQIYALTKDTLTVFTRPRSSLVLGNYSLPSTSFKINNIDINLHF